MEEFQPKAPQRLTDRTRREFLRAAAVVPFAVALTLGSVVGCTPATVSAPTATPAAKATTAIKIGVALSASGQNAKTAGQVLNGYKLWMKQTNAAGGLLGRQIQLVVYDDQSDPATGSRLYERLISQDQVDLVFAPFSSTVTAAVAPVLERYKYPVLTAGASAASIWANGYKYIFGMYSGGQKQVTGFLDLAKAMGAKSVAVVNEDSPFGRDIGDPAVDYAKKQGLGVVLKEVFPPQPTDFSSLLVKIKEAKPDFILAGTYYDEAVLLARQINERGVQAPLVAETIGPDTADFVTALGKQAEGFLGSVEFHSTLPAPGAADFVKSYQAAYNAEPTYQAAMAFASGQLLKQALDAVGALDREKLRDQLAKLDTKTIVGRYKVDDRGFQVGKDAYVVQVQQGVREVVWPLEFATAKAIQRR